MMVPPESVCLQSESVTFTAVDGYPLRGHFWRAENPQGAVLINAATGVQARYYVRFAEVLAAQGYAVLVYDYRGIGVSRPESLRGFKATKMDWGVLDCEGALQALRQWVPGVPMLAVAHSIGGFALGLAPSAKWIERALFVGCQYAYWRDYAPKVRWQYLLRWHVFMPTLALALGYFPGKSLGWLEDLPKGVALEWGSRFHPEFHRHYHWLPHATEDVCSRSLVSQMALFQGDILAVADTSDEYATVAASERLLRYFPHSHRRFAQIDPAASGLPALGHFGFFHNRFRDTLWADAYAWLMHGKVPQGERPWRVVLDLPAE